MLYVQLSSLLLNASIIAKAPNIVVVQNILFLSALCLIEAESLIDCVPSVVLITKSISLFNKLSTICGLPSATLLTLFTDSPSSSIKSAVPEVATILNPALIISGANFSRYFLSEFFTLINTTPDLLEFC